MITGTASKYAGWLLVKIGIALLGIAELVFFLEQTEGDFANGILFFVDLQTNFYFLAFLILYFFTLYLLGKVAGHLIAENRKRQNSVGAIFAVISSVLITVYFSGAIFLINNSIDPEYNRQNQDAVMKVIIQNFIIILICMVGVWIWASNKIASKIPRP